MSEKNSLLYKSVSIYEEILVSPEFNRHYNKHRASPPTFWTNKIQAWVRNDGPTQPKILAWRPHYLHRGRHGKRSYKRGRGDLDLIIVCLDNISLAFLDLTISKCFCRGGVKLPDIDSRGGGEGYRSRLLLSSLKNEERGRMKLSWWNDEDGEMKKS